MLTYGQLLLHGAFIMPIRNLQESDIDEILILDSLVSPNEEPWTESFFRLVLTTDYSFVYVDENTNEILGFIVTKEVDEQQFLITNFGVTNEHQKKGIGTQLMKTAINKMKTCCGVSESILIRLEVRITNEVALNMYRKTGFEVFSSANEFHEMYLYQMGSKPIPVFSNPGINSLTFYAEASQPGSSGCDLSRGPDL